MLVSVPVTIFLTGTTLSMNLTHGGNGQVSDLTTPVSGTSFSLSDSCSVCDIISSGDWSSLGPTQFVGEVKFFGNAPRLTITLGIFGGGHFDLGNMASVSLMLPADVAFTSSSGAFLTAVESSSFLDVSFSYWASSFIETIAANGITTGCGDSNNCPGSPVTRAQMAVFLVRTFGLQ
jgi:hypothetical protein